MEWIPTLHSPQARKDGKISKPLVSGWEKTDGLGRKGLACSEPSLILHNFFFHKEISMCEILMCENVRGSQPCRLFVRIRCSASLQSDPSSYTPAWAKLALPRHDVRTSRSSRVRQGRGTR